MKLNIYNQNGETEGEIKLVDGIFKVKTNFDLIHQAVVAQMANKRQVLAHAKGRSEVRGGGKKPWRQKGTGRARAGSSRSPIWIGGGVTFGPLKTRNFFKKINKKMRRKAMFMILSDRAANNNLVVLEKIELASLKTGPFNEILKNVEAKVLAGGDEKKPAKDKKGNFKTAAAKTGKKKRSILFIDAGKDKKIKYAGRNLAGVKIMNLSNINILDLLKYKNVIFTREAIKNFEGEYKA